jgi:hypothetical protein
MRETPHAYGDTEMFMGVQQEKAGFSPTLQIATIGTS